MLSLKAGILKDKEHLVALAGLFLAGLLAFLVTRALLVPRDFGVLGHFRLGALADNQARPLVYGGRESCEGCHTDEAAVHKSGKHLGVSCEACHGPLAAHAEDPGAAQGRRPNGRDLCLTCHTANAAKPRAFPQINVKEHSESGACVECHAPHRPESAPGVKP
jgi:hypothetical protein